MMPRDLELGNPNSLEAGAPVAVLGGGPAGLTAARDLARRGLRPVLFEAAEEVGGLARTVVRDGYRFDLGGHRFFTKSPEVERVWDEVLGPDLLVRPRLSRIYWRGRFIDYPLRAGNLVRRVGPVELARCSASYAAALRWRRVEAESFEEWVTARFGRRLFGLFFKSYTEKVWGVGTGELRADWAAQRIRSLSLLAAARSALPGRAADIPHSLIEEFRYPRLGPGQMWEAMAAEIESLGGEVRRSDPVTGLRADRDRIAAVDSRSGSLDVSAVISSLPLGETAAAIRPRAPADVVEAGRGLRHRDFLTVALVVEGADLFPDNWVYVHDPEVRVGRVQNFRAWSPWMTPDPHHTCVGLEYFCFEGDDLWSSPDSELTELAAAELGRIGLADPARVRRGWVVRVPKAYPIYDADYANRVGRVRACLDRIPNLQQIGRNGLHRYNNSDHSMLTALRAVENLCDGARHDIWAVNADSVYHEQTEPDRGPYRSAPNTPAMAGAMADDLAA
jgi:protoporphyrinogen oxidase